MRKDLYPEPISLRTRVVLRSKDLGYLDGSRFTDLYHVLAKWVGPCYRKGRCNNVKLLYYNEEVYGVSRVYNFQSPEWRSNARHRDYQTVQHLYDDKYRPDWASPNPLPNPFNKGDAWNTEAIPIIEASIPQFGFWWDWEQFWSCTNLYCSNRNYFRRSIDRYNCEMWSDGSEVVNFKAGLS